MAETLAAMNTRPASANSSAWVPPVSGLLIGAAVTVAGLAPDDTRLRLATAAAGILCGIGRWIALRAVGRVNPPQRS